MKGAGLFFGLIVAVVFCSASVSSEEGASGDPLKDLPKRGTLSSMTDSPDAAVVDSGALGAENPLEGNSSPIIGSVSRSGRDKFAVTIRNQSATDTLSVSVRIVQLAEKGRELKSDFATVILKPGASEERTVSANTNAVTARVDMQNWRLVSRAKKPSAASANAGR